MSKQKSIEEIVENWYRALPELLSQASGIERTWTVRPREVIALLQSERDRAEEVVRDIIKMADALELECGKDGDKGTKQWMAFKGFRNTIRDKYLTNHQDN